MSELRLAKISDFDMEKRVWTVPPENHKNGRKTKRALKRPILEEMVPLITELATFSDDGIHLYTAERTRTVAVGFFWGAWPRRINLWLEKHGEVPIAHWTLHDLRTTLRTNIARFTPPHVCEIMLGHNLPLIWRTYDQYDYLKEQTEAYQAWWEELQRIGKRYLPPG